MQFISFQYFHGPKGNPFAANLLDPL